MTGSLIIVGFFFLGCLLGWSGLMPAFLQNEDLTMYVLYLLMFQVGLSIGSDKQLKEILTNIWYRWRQSPGPCSFPPSSVFS